MPLSKAGRVRTVAFGTWLGTRFLPRHLATGLPHPREDPRIGAARGGAIASRPSSSLASSRSELASASTARACSTGGASKRCRQRPSESRLQVPAPCPANHRADPDSSFAIGERQRADDGPGGHALVVQRGSRGWLKPSKHRLLRAGKQGRRGTCTAPHGRSGGDAHLWRTRRGPCHPRHLPIEREEAPADRVGRDFLV